MPQPLIVSIPHQLGRQEAKRRLDSGISRLGPELAGLVSTLDHSWHEDTLNFRAVAMWQTISGRIEVLDEAVRIEIELPEHRPETIIAHIRQRPAAELVPAAKHSVSVVRMIGAVQRRA